MITSKFALAAAASILLAGGALAQTSGSTPGSTSGSTSGAAGQKMSQAECQTLWSKVDAQSSGSVTQAQAQTYVSDFKSADANNDGRLSSTEFQSACQRGLVRSSAATGSGSGTGGSMGGTGTSGGSTGSSTGK
jgi:hypothetical protein